ncbi:dihydrodipicolinate synthase family protein [Alphaproteobacteria bacterium]|nr:dihydrodipicolinate synthase family protein [Alphaproteobacteria bacterium]
MIDSADLGGLMSMMPAFATDDAADIHATNTISMDRLDAGLNRMIGDGANVIATTGSFGEFHTLLPEEYETIVRGVAEINNRRTPIFVGATGLNTRDVMRKCALVADTSATGVLIGVPFYFPSSPANAIRFFKDIAENFSSLAIMIYHNPPLHNVKLSLPIMQEILKIPQVVAMKDSHREPVEFMRLMDMAQGKVSVFVNQLQYAAFQPIGAPGFWSIDSWMGPWPLLALRDAMARGDLARATEITFALAPPLGTSPANLSWRETAAKIRIRYAGYVDPGPLRPPFIEIPPEVDDAAKRKAKQWKALCDECRAEVAAAA